MIQDRTVLTSGGGVDYFLRTIIGAASSSIYVSSVGYDLNPSYGAGQAHPTLGVGDQTARAPLMNQSGEDKGLLVEVVTAFSAANGAPVVQFHAILSSSDPWNVATSKWVSIGCSAGPALLTGATVDHGYTVGQLTVGKKFFLRFNPWTVGMGFDLTGTAIDPATLRYLNVAATVPNWSTGAVDLAPGGGEIRADLVRMGDISEDPANFIYPSSVATV